MKGFIFFIGLVMLYSCSKVERITPAYFETNIEADTIVFAEIGDFGNAGLPECEVANMVKSWDPDFIISAGDNNYDDGKLQTMKNNITQFYGDFIYNFDAPEKYRCNGKAFQDKVNRFFTTPGNHDDYNKNDLNPYYNFFTLPGNESYYSFRWGPVTFFSLNSVDENLEAQKTWLALESKKASTNFKIAFFHHPPFSSGFHGNNSFMQWPFQDYGIDLVLTGHDHIYNRIEKTDQKGLIYIVNGLGGRGLFNCNENPLDQHLFKCYCYADNYGAMKIIATRKNISVQFLAIDRETPIDTFTIRKP